ncbi:MAG: efflux RND transporter periplasmic adaptor subunit [Planctomycetota bacterium]|nr:efflux RND transporter periplasmic adaptor subunit [Planctomycetota bacterium]
MLKWVILIVVLLIGAGVVGWKYVSPKLHFRPQTMLWKTDKIGRGDILVVVTATGTVGPQRTVMVGSQISGKVKEVRKYSNDRVKEGEVLALLDTEMLESEKKSADVRLSQVRAAISLLKVERENLAIKQERQKSSIECKTISVARARGTLELAAKNRQRLQDLMAVDAAPQTDLDIRVLEEANSKRDLRLMEIDLEQAELDQRQLVADARQLDAREEQAVADVQQAEAALARAITNLGYATIVSPISGVVLQHLVEPGQTVAASFQTPNMFKVASDLSLVRIDAQLDEADIGKIKEAQEVTFDVDAYRSETFTGKVTLVKLQSEQKGNLVTYPVLVEAKNPPDKERPHGKLLPGMTANLRFVVDRRKDVLLLPAAALRFIPPPGMEPPKNTGKDGKEAKKGGTRGTVFVADEKTLLAARPVLVGETDGDLYELLEGEVKEGDEVIVGTK